MAFDAGNVWDIALTGAAGLFGWLLKTTYPTRAQTEEMMEKRIEAWRQDDVYHDEARIKPLEENIREIKGTLNRMDDKIDRLIERGRGN